MSPSVISLIGILLGMVILVFLAFKGYNVITFLLSPHWLCRFLPEPTFCR